MRDLRDSVGSQDGLLTTRSGAKDMVQRPGKPGIGGHSSATVYSRQISEPVTQDEQDTVTVNGKEKQNSDIRVCVCVYVVCACVCVCSTCVCGVLV